MRPPLDDSVVLVTGASSGIGEALARELAARARVLVLVARRRDRLDKLAAELSELWPDLQIDVRRCDLCDRGELAVLCDAVDEAHGGVDILVNNAGLGDVGMFERAAWEKIEAMIELNVRALSYITHRFAAGMVKRGRGGVLMISSGFGLTFLPGFAGYVATKHFVSGLSEVMRLDLAPKGVVVTQVCPGPVATEFEEHVGNFTGRTTPAFMQISAERCARSALRGFARGRAMVVPGILMRIMMAAAALTPRFVMRLLYGPAARWLRRRQEAALGEAEGARSN
jgi:short-subunit dehydrogenase